MKGNYVIKSQNAFRSMLKSSGIKTQKNLAEIVGLGEDYISQIVNGKPTTRVTAYAISKALHENAEIKDFFELI